VGIAHVIPSYMFMTNSMLVWCTLDQWFPNFFSSRTTCGTHIVTTYHFAPGTLHLQNIIRLKVWKTGIDTNVT